MPLITETERRRLEQLDRPALESFQLARLNLLLPKLRAAGGFYAKKWADAAEPATSLEQLQSLEQFRQLPITHKEELLPSGHSHDALNRTYDRERYIRFHQTSGSRGRPMSVYDTAEDWAWWMDGWQFVLDAAGIVTSDRAMLAFSFGPFVGFWSAFDALAARGVLTVPGGGMGSLARIDLIKRTDANVLLCTPNYALRLAEVAAENAIRLDNLSIEKIIVAGEPGGSMPAVRQRIQDAWGATVTDHSGATEVGPWGYGDQQGRGLYVNESQFLVEFLSVESGEPAAEGELSHMVLTTLGRDGAPVIRYRTGDLAKPYWNNSDSNRSGDDHPGDNRFVFLDGGVLSRADDMMIIRGVNIYPSAVEQILRSFPEVVEYRMTAKRHSQMDELIIEVEDRLQRPERIAAELTLRLGLKIEVQLAPDLSLPRSEGKGNRFIDQRA